MTGQQKAELAQALRKTIAEYEHRRAVCDNPQKAAWYTEIIEEKMARVAMLEKPRKNQKSEG